MQVSLFDGNLPFKITKPIRLIEMFAGYGSQHFALKYLGVPCESYKICEWAVKSIQAYKDAHFGEDNTDYSKDLSHYQIVQWLLNKGISANYNTPMKEKQIIHLGEEKTRQIYNNIIATHNLVNIQQVHGKDLEIVDVDKYDYIMTYSFPCQDLSSAGLKKGMAKDSGTRSGMLWEVERILDEIVDMGGELPQVLLMENVPEVIGTKNIGHFAKWQSKLESLGYKNKWQVLNAKDFEVPQNRERCFMVSVLGDYYYDMPQTKPLKVKLRDVLEYQVDEKYYLSDKMLAYFTDMKNRNGFVRGERFNPIDTDVKEYGYTITTSAGQRPTDNFIIIKGKECPNYSNSRMKEWETCGCEANNMSPILDTGCDCLGVVVPRLVGGIGEMKSNNGTQFYQQDRVYDANSIAMCQPASLPGGSYNYLIDKRIRKLTPKECFRLMGVKDEDFENIAKNQSNASLYHLAGDSIVVNVLMAIFKQML